MRRRPPWVAPCVALIASAKALLAATAVTQLMQHLRASSHIHTRTRAGAHYDIGRQRFVFGRNKGVIESAAHWVQREFNVLRINVDYDKDIANAAFAWLVHSVQAAALEGNTTGAHLLPECPEWYREQYADDTLPWLWPEDLLWPLPNPLAPLSKDAYKRIFTSHGLLGLLTRLPVVGSWLKVVIDEEVRVAVSKDSESIDITVSATRLSIGAGVNCVITAAEMSWLIVV